MVLYEPIIFPAARFTGMKAFIPQPDFFIPIIGQNAIITGIGLALLGLSARLMNLLINVAAVGAGREGQEATAPDKTRRSYAQEMPQRRIQDTNRKAKNPARDIITRGALNGRSYVLFRDGSVVVETLLGPKRFGSMTDAQNFIVAN